MKTKLDLKNKGKKDKEQLINDESEGREGRK